MNFKEKFKSLIFSKKKEKPTVKQELKDWAVSFLVAAVVYFLVLPAILGTTSPLVVVSSCSEAGYLNIGDILVIKGVDIEDVKAPLVEVDSLSFETDYSYSDFENGEELTSLNFNGQVVDLNRSSDIVVYNTNPFFGQVIHRVFAKIKKGNDYYLVTKGDANLIPDQLGFNNNGNYYCLTENPRNCVSTLVNEDMIVGKKVLFRIPLLGHVKLLFCDVMPFCEGHSNIGTNYEFKLTC